MVKEKKHRIDKVKAKYDPFVNMIRAKHYQNTQKEKFPVPASQQYFIDTNIAQWASIFGLKYGEIGTLGDIVKSYIWKWSTLTDVQYAELHSKWLLRGFTELQFTAFISYMDAKQIEIETLYQYCKFPKDFLLQTITVSNVTFPILAKDLYIDDLITLTIEKIFAYPTGNDKLMLKPLSAGASKIEIECCCHNVIPTIGALFTNPFVNFTSYNINLLFDYPFLEVTQMDITRNLLNPTVITDIHEIHTTLINPNVTFFMWNIEASIQNPLKAFFVSNNLSHTISNFISYNKVNNLVPTISISVVKTP